MGTDTDPNSTMRKSKYFNMIDEAFGMLCLIISRGLIFHIDSLSNPNKVWLNIEALFRKNDEMRDYQLKNDLISLSPTHFETIQDFFTKFKPLVIHLKQSCIKNKEEQLIFSILSNI